MFHNRKIFIPIGISGSGKSTLGRKYFKDHEIVGADRIREMLTGDLIYTGAIDRAAFVVLYNILEVKMKSGGYIYLDNTNLTSESRKKVVKIAERYEYEVVFIYMTNSHNVELCITRRCGEYFPEHIVRKQYDKFCQVNIQSLSELYTVTTEESFRLDRQEPTFEKDNVYFIGDLHAQYDKFLEWMEMEGITDTNGILTDHDGDEVFLVFVGDLVDRGPKPIEMCQYVDKIVENGYGVCVMGNHENNVARIIGGEYIHSKSSQETAKTFKEAGLDQWYVDFVSRMPLYVTITPETDFEHKKKIICSHAGIRYGANSYPNDGFRNYQTMRGIQTGTWDERLTARVPEYDSFIQVYGHVNMSEERIGEWVVPFIEYDPMGFPSTVCLESHVENEGYHVGSIHLRDLQ